MTGAEIPMRSFRNSLPMALLEAREAAMRLFRPMLAEHELTEQQWRVLRALTAADSPLEVGALARSTSLLAPSLSRILTNLEDRDLIERRRVSHDHRRASISLTPDGDALVRRVAPSSEAMYNRIEEEFGADRLEHLLRELHDLAEIDLGTALHRFQDAS